MSCSDAIHTLIGLLPRLRVLNAESIDRNANDDGHDATVSNAVVVAAATVVTVQSQDVVSLRHAHVTGARPCSGSKGPLNAVSDAIASPDAWFKAVYGACYGK